ncbi:hypothetical protein ACFU5P_30610 [Streptomyces sp. NPDC057433]|uniref:hypothetical protein n=1 Tax=Streptomyces sp. NPDC057433 TaxID=3346132 RepID=UPI003691B066
MSSTRDGTNREEEGSRHQSHKSGMVVSRKAVMMALLLFLILVAVVLGIVGAVIEGLLYLLVIGVVVFVCALAYTALRFRRGGSRHD